MKYILLIALGMLSSGCLLEVMTTTAIQGELAAENAQAGQRAIQQARDTKGKIELDQAISMYTIDKNQYPSSLEDLVPHYLPTVPLRGNGQSFGYNPRTGKVTTQAETTPFEGGSSVMTQADIQNLDALRDAVYYYWQATGLYPESLDILPPLYIDSIPSMSSGGAFLYDNTTGGVNHPAEFNTPEQQGGNTPRNEPRMIQENYSNSQLETLVDLGL